MCGLYKVIMIKFKHESEKYFSFYCTLCNSSVISWLGWNHTPGRMTCIRSKRYIFIVLYVIDLVSSNTLSVCALV